MNLKNENTKLKTGEKGDTGGATTDSHHESDISSSMDHRKTDKALSTFHGFPCLPTEIRLQIWEAARPEPRFIALELEPERGIFSVAKVPNLLHVNQESREVALKWYELAFVGGIDRKPRTYFDWAADGLWVHDTKYPEVNAKYGFIEPTELAMVRRCIWEHTLWGTSMANRRLVQAQNRTERHPTPLQVINMLFQNVQEILLTRELIGPPRAFGGEIKVSEVEEDPSLRHSGMIPADETVWKFYRYTEPNPTPSEDSPTWRVTCFKVPARVLLR